MTKKQLRKPPLPSWKKPNSSAPIIYVPLDGKKNQFSKNSERENKFVTGQGKGPALPLALAAQAQDLLALHQQSQRHNCGE